ncbi:MAG: aa3-type cytochrome c oxidase subunit IV [Paracoccaceae bacterium]
MADHEHGTMNIREHEQTFHGFVTFVKWAVVVILGVLVFLALANA